MFTIEMKIIDFIRNWFKDKEYPPSIREIGKGVGLRSTKAVKYHLDKLVAKGELTRKPHCARTLALSEKSVGLPLVGTVTAGKPVLAEENIEEYISLDKKFTGCFLLKVRGDSMKEAGILANDLVIVRPQTTANNGDIVVALLANEATVKRFYRNKQHILLKPANPFYPVITITQTEDFSIIGVVVGVIRKIGKQ